MPADNVRMNNVLPGWIDSLPATEERRAAVPMQRYGTSEEIAATDRLPRLRRRRLHHRPEHPRRRRDHPVGVIRVRDGSLDCRAALSLGHQGPPSSVNV